ncbi:hypothetical protein HZA39_02215 [Candidatus Peregrinibacteria bacterium]|nr:hypothetical protein [Candidatus Peregrinibacteria bacterium]
MSEIPEITPEEKYQKELEEYLSQGDIANASLIIDTVKNEKTTLDIQSAFDEGFKKWTLSKKEGFWMTDLDPFIKFARRHNISHNIVRDFFVNKVSGKKAVDVFPHLKKQLEEQQKSLLETLRILSGL